MGSGVQNPEEAPKYYAGLVVWDVMEGSCSSTSHPSASVDAMVVERIEGD